MGAIIADSNSASDSRLAEEDETLELDSGGVFFVFVFDITGDLRIGETQSKLS